MYPSRLVLRHLAFTVALLLGLCGDARAFVVCKTPDGSTYATDEPPPNCEPLNFEPDLRHEPSAPDEGLEVETRGRPAVEREAAPAAPPEEVVRQRDEPEPAEEPIRRPESPEVERTHAIASCEQAVAEQLEMPSSARWPSRGAYRFTGGNRQLQIEGYVDAERAVGSSRVQWRCDAAFSGDRWIASAKLIEPDPAPAPPAAAAPPARAAFPDRPSAASAEMRESAALPPAQPPVAAEPPPAAVVPPAPDALPREAPPERSVAAVESPATSSPAEIWKERSSCPGIRFRASAERHGSEGYQVVSGEIDYTGMRPVRDVRVCASGTCTLVRGSDRPMTQGSSEKFSLKTPTLDTPTVTAQCSVMVDGPGL